VRHPSERPSLRPSLRRSLRADDPLFIIPLMQTAFIIFGAVRRYAQRSTAAERERGEGKGSPRPPPVGGLSQAAKPSPREREECWTASPPYG